MGLTLKEWKYRAVYRSGFLCTASILLAVYIPTILLSWLWIVLAIGWLGITIHEWNK